MLNPKLRRSSRSEAVPEAGPSLVTRETYLRIDLDNYEPYEGVPGVMCYRIDGMIPVAELTNAHVRLFDLLTEVFNHKAP